jgi:hypothetical protein
MKLKKKYLVILLDKSALSRKKTPDYGMSLNHGPDGGALGALCESVPLPKRGASLRQFT